MSAPAASSAPASPLAVIQTLGLLTGALDRAVKALREAELDVATKRHEADVNEARLYLRATGPVKEREAHAVVGNETKEGQALVAEAIVRILRQEIGALKVRIDVGRSYGATVRAELQTLGWQEG